ncbi:hypothetical protein [Novosphingobium sp. SG707]|nr:hypothetical protein [Novosphingobium sp. SG707]NKJ00342.1 hypothetical protein [Novosphingobium sp. SG707]
MSVLLDQMTRIRLLENSDMRPWGMLDHVLAKKIGSSLVFEGF